jgi:hypothetical protein
MAIMLLFPQFLSLAIFVSSNLSAPPDQINA